MNCPRVIGLVGILWVCGAAATYAHAAAIPLPELQGSQEPAAEFAKYYQPVDSQGKMSMPSYELPLDALQTSNGEKVLELYVKDPEDRALLLKNGFVVVEGGRVDDIAAPYKRLREQGVPLFVTADTLLHLYHIQFDETLKEIEEKEFYTDIVEVTKAMLAAAEADYGTYEGDLKEAAKRNVAYFAVALKEFEPEAVTPTYVKDRVEWETKRIEDHAGPSSYREAREKSLFRYPEDYSQYKPRGHYTRSEKLKRYFRGMMWYGRRTFLLKGDDQFGQFIPPSKALVDRETARIQTLQGALISAEAGGVKVEGERTVASIWERIYAVTAFYAGFADDLTIYEYREALRDVFGATVEPQDLAREEKFAAFTLEVARVRKPAIFSGTAGAGIDYGALTEPVSVRQLDDILGATQGLRFMGQRYIPDSYMFTNLVSPGAGKGEGGPFTAVSVPGVGALRGFPRGLDMFSVLGSRRAAQIIAAEGDDGYDKYGEQINKLRAQFAGVTSTDWNRNLYWSWLYCLQALVEPRGEGYQTFQKGDAWTDRQLASALASWASLRHDTILYAKQSYTATVGMERRPAQPKGFVEPAPEFFARVLATTRMTARGLDEMHALSGPARQRLANLERCVERLYDLVRRQAGGEALTEADDAFLANLPETLKGVIGAVDDAGLKTTLVADVHTEPNTGVCLQEASGYVDYLVVAYKRAEGDVVFAVGPLLSYYEFKQPMKDRLTDEQWREVLVEGAGPDRPEWNASFTRLRK